MAFLCTQCKRQADVPVRFCPYCGAPGPIALPGEGDPLIGRTVAARYLVHALLGKGGMGLVYRATDTALDRPVALKVLDRRFVSDATMVQRFQREARAASRLNHPNCITVLDFGQMEDGQLFIAMELLAGRGLDRLLADEFPLAQPRVVRIVAQILAALAEAHAAGVIHRDLKLANVMVEVHRDEPDFVKVLDFGIAKLAAGDGGANLTRTGLVCGTPGYMSPEQVRGEELDPRSDLYSVGVILYELLTGQLPFSAETPMGLAMRQVTERPVPPRERRPELEIAPALDAIVVRALAKAREDRFSSADELRTALLAAELGPAVAPARAALPPATPAPAATEVELDPGAPGQAPSVPAASSPTPPTPDAAGMAQPARRRGVPTWVPIAIVLLIAALGAAGVVTVVSSLSRGIARSGTASVSAQGDGAGAVTEKSATARPDPAATREAAAPARTASGDTAVVPGGEQPSAAAAIEEKVTGEPSPPGGERPTLVVERAPPTGPAPAIAGAEAAPRSPEASGPVTPVQRTEPRSRATDRRHRPGVERSAEVEEAISRARRHAQELRESTLRDAERSRRRP